MPARKPRPALPPMSEDDLLRQVVHLARLCGWRVHHARPARTAKGWRTPIQGHAGFPDLVLVRGPVLIFAELKAARGRVRPDQAVWLAALHAAGQRAYTWKPADWPAIEAILTGKEE